MLIVIVLKKCVFFSLFINYIYIFKNVFFETHQLIEIKI